MPGINPELWLICHPCRLPHGHQKFSHIAWCFIASSHAARATLQVAFIFTDAEVREEAFLEYINQLLATGEVAGLFGRDEVDAIVNDVRPIMRAEAPGAASILTIRRNLLAACLE